jgi:ribonucleoside-diphosphate reductase beta chain
LPDSLQALSTDDSPAALARAAVTYNMIVEGVLAETGYHAFLATLQANDVMPGVCEGIAWLKRDESRHIAYGIYLLGRLLAEDGSLWEQVEAQMSGLAPVAIGVVQEIFDAYDPVPFGLDEQAFVGYALGQLQRRLQRLEAARGAGAEFAEQAAGEELEKD